jgi:hypothetical protein
MLIVIALAAGGAYFLMRDLTGPEISASVKSGGRLGLAQPVEVTVGDKSGVQAVTVTVKRGAQSMKVLEQKFPTLEPQRKAVFDLKETRLPEGAFELEIKASDGSYAGFGSGNVSTLNIPLCWIPKLRVSQ